ncbi:uncharacterized protein LOC143471250 isoform X1 [Clavelina lepadiformis]|uniref:uncharacterized protein LOC143471250 isoform X1 n=1 Tax=Clavelina lepadiformis TaxID=159417 RepID=UPI0040417A99
MMSAKYGSSENDNRRHWLLRHQLLPGPIQFDARFGEGKYLMTDFAKYRLRGYLRTFLYMSGCGLFLILGGAIFFLHEGATMQTHRRQEQYKEDVAKSYKMKQSSQNMSSTETSRRAEKQSTTYARELRLVGFVFLGVGALLLVIGIPLAYQFWKRYKAAKEIERLPMLDPTYHEQLKKAYTRGHKDRKKVKKQKSDEKQPTTGDRSNSDDRSQTRSPCGGKFWLFGRQRGVTAEGFRIASHHHPSFNLVPIEGLAALTRDQMGEVSRFCIIESQSEEETTESGDCSSNSSSTRGRIGSGCFRKSIRIRNEVDNPGVEEDSDLDDVIEDNATNETPQPSNNDTREKH